MAKKKPKLKVFISHSSIDTWVPRPIASHVERCGATYFLDEAGFHPTGDFEDKIIEAAESSSEILVLLTPWATTRPYIWMEIGSFWSRRKAIVGILHGLSANTISVDPNIPVVLKKTTLITLNEIDRYFADLRERVKAQEGKNVS